MNGFKIHHGLPLDTKLAVIAKRAGVRRGEALALWLTLMDRASQNMPRGSVGPLDPEELAFLLEFDPGVVESTLQALRDKEMITATGALTDWEKSQTISSTYRTRDYRARRLQGKKKIDVEDDSEAAASRRRQRLQHEMAARHKKRGRVMTKTPPLTEDI
jgi:hypothetical protein